MDGISLQHYLFLAALLFSLGVFGVLVRRNALVVFMCVELMLNASNLTFLAFARDSGSDAGHLPALFVIMLLSLGEAVGPSKITIPRVIGGLAAAGLFALLVIAARPFVPAAAQTPASFGTLQSIGAQLYTQWLAPFEAVSLLLLVAMVGAVVVAKSRV